MKKGQEITFNDLSLPIQIKQLNDVINYMLSFVNGYNLNYFNSMLQQSDVLKTLVNNAAGTVLYQASDVFGVYCDGSLTPTEMNSVSFPDACSSGAYKRLRIYVRTVYGLVCAEMPIDRKQGYLHSGYGYYQGGIIFPTGDSVSGATSNYLAKLSWCLIHENEQWTFQMTDSGWVNLGTGAVKAADYSANTNIAVTSAAPTWNQRHNLDYSVYKIVGYTV